MVSNSLILSLSGCTGWNESLTAVSMRNISESFFNQKIFIHHGFSSERIFSYDELIKKFWFVELLRKHKKVKMSRHFIQIFKNRSRLNKVIISKLEMRMSANENSILLNFSLIFDNCVTSFVCTNARIQIFIA